EVTVSLMLSVHSLPRHIRSPPSRVPVGCLHSLSAADFFFQLAGAHRDLRSFPTRRSSDLNAPGPAPGPGRCGCPSRPRAASDRRSEEHTSELQSRFDLVCRLLLEKKKELIPKF